MTGRRPNRTSWFQDRVTWPGFEADAWRLERERRRTRRDIAAPAQLRPWTPLGPPNVGGRLTSIVCHPARPDRVWVGAAGGGVWFSPDAGISWDPLWDDPASYPTLNVGALAIDPTRPERLYCGTGEANSPDRINTYPGMGLFSSSDRGRTWRLIAESSRPEIPTRIATVVVDPQQPQTLYLGGLGFSRQSPGGLSISHDAGQRWNRVTALSDGASYWCNSIVVDPNTAGRLYVSVTENGSRNGIWRSEDGGVSWAHLLEGLPYPGSMGRTSLALAASRPDTLYALVGDAGDRVLGVYRSDDRGDSWYEIGGARFAKEDQLSYNNTIVVHPTDADFVVFGGVDLHRTRNGGRSWEQLTWWTEARGTPYYAHADHHALLIPASEPDRIYSANDGGMDVSFDRGDTWEERRTDLVTTMYYDVAVAQSNPAVFGGGMQDNGTYVSDPARPDAHWEAAGGDGGWIVFNPTDETRLFVSIYEMRIWRIVGSESSEITPPAFDEERLSIWMAYVAIHPADSSVLFTGSQRVWHTTDSGATWHPVSGYLDGSDITAIEVCPEDPSRIYVGTENGGVFGGSLRRGRWTWTDNLGGDLPGYLITRLASRPDRADVVYATIANDGHSHLWRSDRAGTGWQDVDAGRLPDVPLNSVAVPGDEPDSVIVAGDGGVFRSPDQGSNWENLSGNLPNARVVDIVYDRGSRTLTAATYGRGLWRLRL